MTWGLSTDIPVPGDYDGDGEFDMAVFRPSNNDSYWYIRQSSTQSLKEVQFLYNDIPVPSLYIP